MKPQNAGDYIPLKTGESGKVQLLWGCREILEAEDELIEKRLLACGMRKKYRTMRTWIGPMCEALLMTVDPVKRATFYANLINQELRVVNKSSVNTTKDMTLLMTDDLYWLITDELRNHCAVCMGCGEDMRHCEFHKRLKRMTMFELDEKGGVCMGRQLLDQKED